MFNQNFKLARHLSLYIRKFKFQHVEICTHVLCLKFEYSIPTEQQILDSKYENSNYNSKIQVK